MSITREERCSGYPDITGQGQKTRSQRSVPTQPSSERQRPRVARCEPQIARELESLTKERVNRQQCSSAESAPENGRDLTHTQRHMHGHISACHRYAPRPHRTGSGASVDGSITRPGKQAAAAAAAAGERNTGTHWHHPTRVPSAAQWPAPKHTAPCLEPPSIDEREHPTKGFPNPTQTPLALLASRSRTVTDTHISQRTPKGKPNPPNP